MRLPSRFFPVVLSPLLIFSTNGDPGCPLEDHPMTSPAAGRAAAYRTASANAELVAPSGSASASGRRRAATPGPVGTSLPAVNFVDTNLFEAQKAAGVVPTTVAGDEEFLRRVTLDLTGQIPDSTAVTAFVADSAADKRARKIDELLASEAFVDRWTLWFGDLVQNVQVANNAREYYIGRNGYYNFIKASIRSGKPYDQMVRELIRGSGDSFVVGEANFVVRQLQRNGPPQDTYDNLVSQTGERFLGMPLLCLSCHSGVGHLEQVNTYLRDKTRTDFWAMAAFFARTRAPGTRYSDPNNPNNNNILKFNVSDQASGEYQLNTNSGNKSPRTPTAGGASSVPPAYMFTGEVPRAGEGRREAYARMLTADRQFARAAVNYLWKEMFGIGIVEPVYSFDLARLDPSKVPPGLTLQPTNARLLEDLTDSFIASGYNLRSILRTMAVSTSYQLSAKYTPGAWSESWTTLFARRYPRRLQAEMLLDAITKATSVPATLSAQGIGPVARAVQLPDSTEPGPRTQFGQFLNEFGRGDRDDSLRSNDSSMTQALSLLNHTIVTNRVRRATANSTVAKVLASTSDPGSVADQLYLATLSRMPTASERAAAVSYLNGGALGTRAEDLQFSLINQLEFLFN